MKAIVFDLDDTLYPERMYAFSGFAAVSEMFADTLGDPVHTSAEMGRLFDTEFRARVFNEILAQHDLGGDTVLLQHMIETFRRHQPNISYHPDARRALLRLKPDYPLGVITDGPSVQQRCKATALDLESHVHEMILTGALGKGFGKPHPRAFELMSEALNVSPEACVYVGDNPSKDFAGPNALGWKTIQVVRQDGIYREAPTIDSGKPHAVIQSLDELDDHIRA